MAAHGPASAREVSHDNLHERFRNRSKSCWTSGAGRRLAQDFLEELRPARRELRRRGRRRSACRGDARRAGRPGPYPDPDFRQLDSWIVIHEDNTATFYVGKTDCGQGTGTAFRQMMSDELDIAYDKTTCIMGSTDITVDQGGSGGSDAIQTDGWPMRRVAAEARRVLLEMASARFGVPVDQLAVSDGVITVKADPSKQRHLRRTDRRKEIQCRADGRATSTRPPAWPRSSRYRNSRSSASRRSATTFPPRWTAR